MMLTAAALVGIGFMGCTVLHGSGPQEPVRGAEYEVPKPTIVSASEWGSEPDPIPEERRHTPRYLTIHHSGVLWNEDDEPLARLRGLQSWGRSHRGWPDLPYHYLIAPDGRIFEGRSVEYEPETNTDYDTMGHIGVQAWGSFGAQRVSIEQIESLVALLAWLAEEHEIDPRTIQGHKDVAQTACPGDDLYRYIADGTISGWVRETIRGQDPEIRLKPPLPDGPTEMIPGGSESH